ncbi:MAG: S1 RNA-binding domain-containing protein [Anaerolineae bacterium]|nr:S1 RNA-binding domain-containing protein [Anaerolineae bacterium]
MGEEETIVVQQEEEADLASVEEQLESPPEAQREAQPESPPEAQREAQPSATQDGGASAPASSEAELEEVEDQAALMAAMEGDGAHPMESLLREDYDVQTLRRGQIVEGVVVQIRDSEVLVDVGAKSEGVIWGRELERLGPDGVADLQEGQKLLVYVVTPEDKNGNPVLSLSRAQAERDWRDAEEMFESGQIFEGAVAGFNKGGVIVRFGRVRGFVPASQITSLRGRRRSDDADNPLATLVGKEMQLKVIEIDRGRNRLILSERAAMREWRRQNKERLLAELQEGDIRTGEVISICDFGVFVDLGGADGLVHLSELSWRRVAHPSEILKVGDEVEVYVLNVDRDRKRIGLSLKRLEPDPWTVVGERYHEGQLVEGTITKLVKFGAFARIFDEDVEGLIHLSELSDQRITHPREVVQEGDIRTLRVIRLDPERRRIGLSLKRVASSDYVDVDWQDGYDAAESEDEAGEEEEE